jgi:hypothetical protein
MSELCVRKTERERERGRKWRRNEDGEWSKRQGVVEKREARSGGETRGKEWWRNERQGVVEKRDATRIAVKVWELGSRI